MVFGNLHLLQRMCIWYVRVCVLVSLVQALVKRAGIKQGESDSRGGSPLPVDGDPFEECRKRKSRRKKERQE